MVLILKLHMVLIQKHYYVIIWEVRMMHILKEILPSNCLKAQENKTNTSVVVVTLNINRGTFLGHEDIVLNFNCFLINYHSE